MTRVEEILQKIEVFLRRREKNCDLTFISRLGLAAF